MIALSRAAGLKTPAFRQDGWSFVQTLWRPIPEATGQATTQVAEQVTKLLRAAVEPVPREQLQEAIGLQNREHFRQAYLEPLVTGGWLVWTVPDKPTSRLQRYRLTAKGRAWLALRAGGSAP